MKRHVEIADAEYGFTWYRVEGRHLLESDDGGFRQVNESVVELLKTVARGELTAEELRAQVDGGPAVVDESETSAEEVLALVERYVEEGVLREGEPVVRVEAPADIRLWPRVLAFLALLSVVGSAVVPILAALPVTLVDRIGLPQVGAMMVFSVVLLGVHEYGHYVVGNRHFDPSIRVDTINGVVPAVITDTTGSWVLPRNRRVWVNLAGPSLELAAAVPLVLLHYAVPGHLLVQLALVVVFAHVGFALNPLIHGDGFWMLCDLFDLRDVRGRGIDDLTNRRLSWRALYVVLSYGFGVVLLLNVVVVLALVLGVV